MLEPSSGEKILDVGSGSGWQTALLAYIVSSLENESGKIVAVERISELAQMTQQNLDKFSFIQKNVVTVVEGDGSKGAKAEAPFDKIIAAAEAKKIPSAWKQQLKIGGKIVAPVENSVCVLEKIEEEKFSEKNYFGFSFVPLIAGE